MKEIVFVCTGNAFRSIAAERLLQKYLQEHAIVEYKVSSAGINPRDEIHPYTVDSLLRVGAYPYNHRPQELTEDIADSANLLVAMSLNHQEHIWSDYSIEAPLFNEIAYNKREPLYDLGEMPRDFPVRGYPYFDYAINYINDAMPFFVTNLPRFL